MNRVPLVDRAGLPKDKLRPLEQALGDLQTLADVLAWARTQQPPAALIEVITQDEFTHDVVIASGPPADQIHLVFDTT